MAVNYGGDNTEAPVIPSSSTPHDGVVDKSGQVFAEGVTSLFEKAGEILKAKKQSKNDAIIAEFASKQLLIADGLEQGTIASSAYARSLARKNLLEAISANPSLAKELIAADGSLISLPGGTGEVRDGTEEEKRASALKDKLVTEGIVSPDASEEEFKTAAEMRVVSEEANRRYEERMKTLDLQLKTNTLSEQDRKRLEDEKDAELNRYLQDNSGMAHQMMKTKFEEILKDPNTTEADKQVMIEEYFNQWYAETSGTLGEVDSQKAQYFLKPMEELRDLYVRRAIGEMGDAELKRGVDRNLALQKKIALADPYIARMAVASDLFGESAFMNALVDGTKESNDALLRFLAGGSPSAEGAEPAPAFVKLPEEKKALKAYLNGITISLGSTDPAVKTEAEAQLTSTLASLEDYEGLIRSDPTKAIEVVNWIGSASFIAARKKNPELFSNIAGATDVLTRHYSDEVWGMVSREFVNADISIRVVQDPKNRADVAKGAKLESTTEKIGVRTTDSGMEFMALDIDADQEVLDEVRRLNKDLKPVINNTVHAFAHLDGRTDYGKVWEEGAAEFLGGSTTSAGPDDRGAGGDSGDDFTLKDFTAELENVGREDGEVSEPVGSVAEAGKGYTVVVLPDGTKEKRTGARNWRNNNPGNIEYGPFAKSQGAVGSDGRFAVFETYEAGRAAKAALIFESKGYRGKTIYGVISRYAPDFENDTDAYASAVARAIGVPTDTPVADLTAEQREAMLDAMERVEGFKVGKTVKLE